MSVFWFGFLCTRHTPHNPQRISSVHSLYRNGITIDVRDLWNGEDICWNATKHYYSYWFCRWVLLSVRAIQLLYCVMVEGDGMREEISRVERRKRQAMNMSFTNCPNANSVGSVCNTKWNAQTSFFFFYSILFDVPILIPVHVFLFLLYIKFTSIECFVRDPLVFSINVLLVAKCARFFYS